MYETPQEGSEGELSFLTFNKSENIYWHKIMEIGYAPIFQYRTIAVWVDEKMTR